MNEQLTKQIMRRVYVVWAMRALVSSVALKLYTLVVFIIAFANYVSFKDVINNFMSVYKTSFSSFMYSAFANTEVVTLALIAGTTALLFWLVKDIMFTHKHSSVAI